MAARLDIYSLPTSHGCDGLRMCVYANGRLLEGRCQPHMTGDLISHTQGKSSRFHSEITAERGWRFLLKFPGSYTAVPPYPKPRARLPGRIRTREAQPEPKTKPNPAPMPAKPTGPGFCARGTHRIRTSLEILNTFRTRPHQTQARCGRCLQCVLGDTATPHARARELYSCTRYPYSPR